MPSNISPLNLPLVGMKDGRLHLQTPALVVDHDLLLRNITHMAEHVRQHGLNLRPHSKTHKSVKIAQLQIAAGAIGICCAKLGEAEVMSKGGIASILLTSPVVILAGMTRLAALHATTDELILTCDDLSNAKALNEAARQAGQIWPILIDIDPGMGRTGIMPGPDALVLVEYVAQAKNLAYRGLQFYAGHLQHLPGAEERQTQAASSWAQLKDFYTLLQQYDLPPSIISGGGTGTYDIDPASGLLTELQAGSYVFMDRQYNEIWSTPPFATALSVQSTVISSHRPGLATTDAGLKSFATDAQSPVLQSGAPDGASYFFFGDEQGGILYTPDQQLLALGDSVRCTVPHCDPTVNLYDYIHVVQGDMLMDIWPVDARGCSA